MNTMGPGNSVRINRVLLTRVSVYTYRISVSPIMYLTDFLPMGVPLLIARIIGRKEIGILIVTPIVGV